MVIGEPEAAPEQRHLARYTSALSAGSRAAEPVDASVRPTISDAMLPGGGEMGARTRAFDWAHTPVGPIECWSHALRTTVEILLASRHPMFLWWGAELVQFYNDAYRTSLGPERHPSALGARAPECWAEIWPIIGPRIDTVMTRGESIWVEDRRVPITRHGRVEQVYWTCSFSPVRDDDGRIAGVLVVAQDTSSRVVDEQQLRLSRERLRAMFEHAALGLALADTDGRFVQVNPAFCAITGYSADELCERDFLHVTHPAHRAESIGLFERLFRREIPSFVVEKRLQHKDGSEVWVRSSVAMLPGGDGHPTHVVAVVEDIGAARAAARERARLHAAERKALRAAEAARLRAEAVGQRLATVLRQAPAYICVLRGPDHVFEMANDAYHRLVGYRDVIGRSVREVVPEVAEQGFAALLDHVLETGESYVGTEVPLRIRRAPDIEADEQYITFVLQALVEPDGTRSGIFVHGIDVTEQVRARAEVERARRDAEDARQRAEEANAVKSQFLATMSHELRTPLNAIGGYAQLIELGVRGPITDAQREDLVRIQHAQQHLLGLINSVLNYAKLEAGRVHYDLTTVAVLASVQAVETLVAPQMSAKGLRFDPPACAPDVCVRADAEKLRQILVNLLTNAIKFTTSGGSVRVSCEVIASTGKPGMVALRVADSGVGIAADRIESIFDPFVQVNRRLTSSDEGVGLGLAISRDLARAMGGDLTVESTIGRGSTFTLLLPRARV